MTASVTYSTAFQQGVQEEMIRDESIFILGTDIYERGGHWAQVKGLGAEFGRERVRDAPISEAAMVAAGVGAAMSGIFKQPVVLATGGKSVDSDVIGIAQDGDDLWLWLVGVSGR